jgi:hypothetical protein
LLTLVILATWEAEMRRLLVPGQPGMVVVVVVVQDPISLEKNLGIMVPTYHLSFFGKLKIGGSQSRVAWVKSDTLSLK